MKQPKIGFIGLGIMGKPMAKNLLKAGYSLTVYDIFASAVEDLAACGAGKALAPGDVAGKSEVIITMLPDSPDVEKVVLGKDGVLESIKPGSVLIDMSSITPSVSKKIAAELEKKGAEMLDAPVSGGEPGAVKGELSIMAGGKKEVFDKYLDVLKIVGKNIVRVGDLGAGNVAKFANQIIGAIILEAIAEAFVLAKKAGVEPDILYDAIKDGLAGGRMLDLKMPMIKARNFKPGFKVKLHQKDLKNALLTASELNVPLPVTAFVQQIMGGLVNNNKGDWDNLAVLTFIEELGGEEL